MFNKEIIELLLEGETLVSLINQGLVKINKENSEKVFEDITGYWHDVEKGKRELHDAIGISWEDYSKFTYLPFDEMIKDYINKKEIPLASSIDKSGNIIESGDKEFDEAIKLSEGVLDENFHVCLVCNGTGKKHDGNPCPMCTHEWKSARITSPEECMVDGGNMDNISNFFGFDKGWDL